MVRNYRKKSTRKHWHEGHLYEALESVRSGKSCSAVALQFGMPRSTLQKKFNAESTNVKKSVSSRSGFGRTFTDDQEQALVSLIKEMETKLMGLDGSDVRRLAYQFAEKIKISHNFNDEKKIAGKDWLRSYMSRHELSHRKAEHTSSARAHGFNEASVQEFFDLLKMTLDKYNFTPDRIYNVDETGISVVPKSSPKIIAQKGRRQVGGLTAAERGESVTAEICMSAAGVYMPPMLIFPRVKENPELLKDAPPGAWAEFHKSGYMQTEIFTRWFEKFIKFSQASIDNPALLLFDGHVSHVKNLEVIELANKNGVVILCFPPHCTHKMQPLDVGFNDPLNICFGKEVSNFQRQGHKATLKNLFGLFGKAYIQAAKMETAINSFKKCGIYPFNSEVFAEDFLALKVSSSKTCDTNNSESAKNIEMFQDVMRDILSVEKKNTHSESKTQTTEAPTHALPAVSLNYDAPSTSQSSNNQIDLDGNISIPLSYLLQAKDLISHLNSTLQTHCGEVGPLEQSNKDQHILYQELPTSDSSNNFNENVPKKNSRKGKAAVISSESYKNELIAEKLMKMKKEKVENEKCKPKAQEIAKNPTRKRKNPFEPQTQEIANNKTLKRKQTSTASPATPLSSRKPLGEININQCYLQQATTSEPSFSKSLVDAAANDNYSNIPESAIVNAEKTFLDGEEIEICYVDEDVARALNFNFMQ